jgi:hypothetical protein
MKLLISIILIMRFLVSPKFPRKIRPLPPPCGRIPGGTGIAGAALSERVIERPLMFARRIIP